MHIVQATNSYHCSVCRCCRLSPLAYLNRQDMLSIHTAHQEGDNTPCYLFDGVTLPSACFVSTGGCAVASDAICHEVMGFREAGKPVVVSMGDCAASGGYLISGHSSQATCLSLPITKHSLPHSLAACKDTPELMAKSHKHDRLLHQHPACVARTCCACLAASSSHMGSSRLCSQLVKLDAQSACW